MADESASQKTEKPTPRRIQEARKKGQLPRSRELVSFAVSLCGVLGLAALAAEAPTFLREGVAAHLHFDAADLRDTEALTGLAAEATQMTLAWLSPLLALATVGAILGSVLVGGWNLSSKALVPDFSRTDPIKGVKRIFGAQGLAELGKGLAKFLLLGAMLCGILWNARYEILHLGQMAIPDAVAEGASWLLFTLAVLCGGLLLIALIDVPFQLHQHTKQLRMSRHEVREDMKQTEGRPEVKQRQRAAQQEAANRRLRQVVPQASVVISNPQHFAVALLYQADSMNAPKLLAKGRGEEALLIRRIAREHGVPQVETPPLARALYRHVREGALIPAALYLAVAQVLGYVFQLDQHPDATPPQPPVPEDWQWSPAD